MPKCTATMYSIFFNLLALFANIYHIAGKQEGVILSSVVWVEVNIPNELE